MQAWVFPAAGAAVIALVVLIVLAVFFCRRAIAERASKKSDVSNDRLSPLETGNLLLKEQALDRFVLFQLNFLSLAWSCEHSITHRHRDLVYLRRFINILAVFLGLFAVGFADVIWQNWCCYPSGYKYTDYNNGTCSDPMSPINNPSLYPGTNPVPGVVSCTQIAGWEWVSNAAFVGCIFLSLVLHMYLSYRFIHDVRFGLEGNYTGIIDAIEDHALNPEKTKRLKEYTWMSFDHHANVQKNTTSFSPHEINLHRLGHLMLDPFAIFFGYPHIVMSRSDLAIANFCNIFVFIVAAIVLGSWAQPNWQGRCCYYDENTRSGAYGRCDDPHAPINSDPFRLKCGLLSWQMTVLLGIMCLNLLISFGLWLYTFILFHYILRKSNAAVLAKLDAMAKTDSHLKRRWLKKSPPPPYDYHRS